MSVRTYYLAINVLLSVLKYFQSCVRTYGSYDINIYLDLDLDIFVLDFGGTIFCAVSHFCASISCSNFHFFHCSKV
jgi:hypothetical protein